jgi:hypothetical protein
MANLLRIKDLAFSMPYKKLSGPVEGRGAPAVSQSEPLFNRIHDRK